MAAEPRSRSSDAIASLVFRKKRQAGGIMIHYLMNWANLIALAGIGFTFASFLMKGMLPLRALAVGGNICFIAYGIYEWIVPSMILNGALLPINLKRVWDIRQLTAEIKQATEKSPVSEWLLPQMTRRAFAPGEVLFSKGDKANEIIYIASGQVTVEDRTEPLGAGELIGEIGLFSPDRLRTKTVTCQTSGVLYQMTDEMIYQLYYQHPAIGFYFMRLVAQRLLRDIDGEVPAKPSPL
jgi:CRP/FNR family cyclic AMP-dependent transcriptional regulator